MKPLIIAVLLILAVAIALSGVNGLMERLREPTYSEVIEDYARAEAIQRQSELEAEWAPRRAWFLALFVAAAALVALAYLASLAALHVRNVSAYARPDAAGLLPVARADQHAAVAALAGFHTARIEEAKRALVPANLHYAPQFEYDYSFKGEAGALLPGDVAPPAALPSFAGLLDAGRIGKGQPLYLGGDVATGEGVWGDWRDLYSAGLGGKQGSGKSWTAASIIAQSLLGGARVVLCDPHAGDEESLTTRLEPLVPALELVADEPAAILQAARYTHDEFQRRKELAKAKRSYDARPLILVIDEWTALLRGDVGDELPPLLAALTTEGRKYGVNALLLAQRWEAAAAGGSDVRNTLTAHYVHRMRGDEARMMTGLRSSALPDDTLALQPGQAYLFDTKGNIRKVATPQMTAADLGRVAQLLGSAPSAEGVNALSPATSRIGFRPLRPEVAGEVGTEVAGGTPLRGRPDAEKWTAEEARIVAALAAGKKPGELAEEMAGGKGGDKYQKAAAKIAAVIARLAAQRTLR